MKETFQEERSDKKTRKSKLDMLRMIRKCMHESGRNTFYKSDFRNPPWNIDPRSAEECLRIAHFSQQEMPQIDILETQSNFLVQAMIPATQLTINEALDLINNYNIDTRQNRFATYPSKAPLTEDIADRKELAALESYPKLQDPDSYWSRSKVYPEFVCHNCESHTAFPWHCFEPMDLEIIENNIKLYCWRCKTRIEIPTCKKCGRTMRLRYRRQNRNKVIRS